MRESLACPTVAVVILTWNGGQVTLYCLASVGRLDYPCYSLVVVDNGSTDGSLERIRSRFPEAVLIAHDRNMGVSKGYNSGLRWTLERGYDYAFLLNNDVLLAPDALRVLVDEAERHPGAGMVSPKIYLGQPPSDRIYWTGGRLTLNPFRAPTRGYRRRDRGRYDKVCEVQLAAIAAALVRSDVIRKVGLLDPDFFYLCDDFDWCLRARECGYHVLYVPDAHVWHLESLSIGFLSPRMVYYYVRNMLLLAQRHCPRRRLLHATLMTQVPFFMAILLATRGPSAMRAPLWAIADYRSDRFGEAHRHL